MPQFEKYLQLNIGSTVPSAVFNADLPATSLEELGFPGQVNPTDFASQLGVEERQGRALASLLGRFQELLDGNRAMGVGRIWVPGEVSIVSREPETQLEDRGLTFVVPGKTDVTLTKKWAGVNRPLLRAHHIGLIKNTSESPRATLRLPEGAVAASQRILIITGTTQKS